MVIQAAYITLLSSISSSEQPCEVGYSEYLTGSPRKFPLLREDSNMGLPDLNYYILALTLKPHCFSVLMCVTVRSWVLLLSSCLPSPTPHPFASFILHYRYLYWIVNYFQCTNRMAVSKCSKQVSNVQSELYTLAYLHLSDEQEPVN